MHQRFEKMAIARVKNLDLPVLRSLLFFVNQGVLKLNIFLDLCKVALVGVSNNEPKYGAIHGTTQRDHNLRFNLLIVFLLSADFISISHPPSRIFFTSSLAGFCK